mgnify:CR=1 FL=1
MEAKVTIESLNSETKRTKSAHAALEDSMAASRTAFANTQAGLEHDLVLCRRSAEKVSAELTNAHVSISALQEKEEASRLQITRLERAKNDLEASLAEATLAAETMARKHVTETKAAAGRAETLKSKIALLEAQTKSKSQAAGELVDRIHALEEQLEEARALCLEKDEECCNKARELLELSRCHNTVQSSLDSAESQVSSLEIQLSTLESRLSEAEADLATANVDADVSAAEVQNLKAKVSHLKAQCSDGQERMTEMSEARDTAAQQASEAILALEEKVNSLVGQMAEDREEAAQAATTAHRQIASLQAEAKTTASSLIAEKLKRTTLETEVSELKTEAQELDQLRAAGNRQITALERETTSLQSDRNALREAEVALLAQIESMHSEITQAAAAARASSNQLTTLLEDSQDKVHEQEKTISCQISQIDALGTKVGEAEARVADGAAQLEETHRRVLESDTRVANLQSDKSQLQADLAQIEQEALETQTFAKTLSAELDLCRTDNTVQSMFLKSSNEDLECTRLLLSKSEATAISLQTSLDHAHTDLAALRAKLTDADVALHSAQSEAKMMVQHADDLESQIARLESAIIVKETQLATATRKTNMMSDASQKASEDIQKLQETVTVLNADASANSAQHLLDVERLTIEAQNYKVWLHWVLESLIFLSFAMTI